MAKITEIDSSTSKTPSRSVAAYTQLSIGRRYSLRGPSAVQALILVIDVPNFGMMRREQQFPFSDGVVTGLISSDGTVVLLGIP